MLTLAIALSVLCLTLIVPLAIWGATGSFGHAMHAWREYMLVMAFIVGPGVVVALLIVALP